MPNELAKRRHRSRENAGSLRQINLLEGRLFESRYEAGPLEHRRRQRVTSPVNPAQREEELDAWVGGRLSCHCFDRRRARLRRPSRNGFRRRQDHIRTGLAGIPHFGRCRGQSTRGALTCIGAGLVWPRLKINENYRR